MLRILPRSQGNVVGVELSGKITEEDYTKILIPTFNRVIAEQGKARVLLDFADDYKGYEMKACLEDIRYSVRHLRNFEKCATINAPAWAKVAVKILDTVTSCKSRAFEKHRRDEAWGWIEG